MLDGIDERNSTNESEAGDLNEDADEQFLLDATTAIWVRDLDIEI